VFSKLIGWYFDGPHPSFPGFVIRITLAIFQLVRKLPVLRHTLYIKVIVFGMAAT